MLTVKDKLYFVSGDISANLMRMMTVLFVNKKTLEQRGYEYDALMEQVKAYEWTLDDLISMTTGALFTGLGYRYMIKSNRDNEVFRLSNQVISETAVDYVTKLKNWSDNNDMWIDPQEKTYGDIFKNGDSFFILHRAWYGFELQKTDIQYAVLPAPALDINQKEYYTTIGNQYSAFGICSESVDYYIALESGSGSVLPYLVTNIISLPVRDKTNFTFNSTSDPVRRQVNGFIDAANAKLLEYIEA